MTKEEIRVLLQENVGRFYTYELLRPNEEPFYVGKGTVHARGKPRLFCHEKPDKHNQLKSNIIKKIVGSGNKVRYKICEFFDDEKDALTLEVELIARYGRRDNGTGILSNYTDGGDGICGAIHTPETKSVMSIKRKKYLKSHTDRAMFLAEWSKTHPGEVLERQRKSNITNRSDEKREAKILFYKNLSPEARDRRVIRRREWVKNNPEKEFARQAKANAILGSDGERKKNSERRKKWFKDNPERAKEINQKRIAWIKNNPEKIEKLSQKRVEWRKNNPEAVVELRAKIAATNAIKTRIRLRCLAFIEKHGIDIVAPDGRTSISIWQDFEEKLEQWQGALSGAQV